MRVVEALKCAVMLLVGFAMLSAFAGGVLLTIGIMNRVFITVVSVAIGFAIGFLFGYIAGGAK